MANHNDIGYLGEKLAMEFLIAEKYEILEKNWRYKKAEIDLIIKKDNILIFVEIKTRSTDFFGNPEDFVSDKKMQMMLSAAQIYMENIGHDWEIRFDIITVILKKVKILPLHILKMLSFQRGKKNSKIFSLIP